MCLMVESKKYDHRLVKFSCCLITSSLMMKSRTNALSLRFGISKRDILLALLFNFLCVEVLAKIIRQTKEIKFIEIRKEEINVS